jgi:hypothetical protein
MRILTNERHYRQGRFWATTLSVAGLLMLITATITSFIPQIGSSSFPLLIFGIILSLVGIRLSHRWVRPPLAHETLAGALKGLSKDSVLLNYYPPAPHLLITPNGIFSLTTRNQPFQITVSGDYWADEASAFKKLRRQLGQDQLGNPIAQAKRDAERASAWIEKTLGAKLTVTPLVVFLSSATHLEVEQQTAVPMTYADKRTPSLKAYLKQDAAAVLTSKQLDDLLTTLQTS